MFTRPKNSTPPEQLADYVRLFNAAQVIGPDDAATMAASWQQVCQKPWYQAAAIQANDLAFKKGRITAEGIVTGELTDPELGQLAGLADVVSGGGVIDVATAVLVRDLLSPAVYRKLTNWWARNPSTWLPGDTITAEPPAEQEPVPRSAPQPGPEPAPPARSYSADVASAGAVADEPDLTARPILPGKLDVPASPAPRQRRPHPDRDEVMATAAGRAKMRAIRMRRSGWANFRGVLLFALAVPFSIYAAGDQLGAQLLPPASISTFGDGGGWVICAMIWLGVGIVCLVAGAAQLRLAKTIRHGRG